VTRAPDLAAPVAGFRSWRIANGKLLSPYIPCRWEGRTLHAECFDANRSLQRGRGWLAEPHSSPHPDCQCGIYAYHRPGLRTYYGELWWCEGVIAAWGRLVVHADGWRAEHARLEALARPDRDDPRLEAALGALAERLGVPLVARGELEAVAADAGGVLPGTLRPAVSSRGA
jgi:hypothetical protein